MRGMFYGLRNGFSPRFKGLRRKKKLFNIGIVFMLKYLIKILDYFSLKKPHLLIITIYILDN